MASRGKFRELGKKGEDGEEMPGGTEIKIEPSALRALLLPPAAAESLADASPRPAACQFIPSR